MRLRLGRPDLGQYRDRFAVPTAWPDSPLSITFLGVASLLVTDGESSLLTDGFFSRPGLLAVGTLPLAPDERRISACLERAGVQHLAAVIPVHTHFDHALDSATVATLTGAPLVGSESAANIGRGYGLADQQVEVVSSGDEQRLGAYRVTFLESEHCPPDRYPGPIERPLRPPARASRFRCGSAWSLLVAHVPTGRRLLIQGSAGYRPGLLDGTQAEVAYLGVGQLGLQPEPYLLEYWQHTVRAVGARRVVLIHWDDFFRPLDEPLRALPFAGDDLDATMRVLVPLADEDGVELQFPTVWQREDPWRDL